MTKKQLLKKLVKLLNHKKSDDFQFYTMNIQPLMILLGEAVLKEYVNETK